VAGIDLEEFTSKAGDSKENYKLLETLVDENVDDPGKVLKEYVQIKDLGMMDCCKTMP